MSNATWTFGIAVATARNMMGLDQEELAQRLLDSSGRDSWRQTKVSRIEKGRTQPTVQDLMDLAEVQGMSYAWYLDGPLEARRGSNSDNPGYLKRHLTAVLTPFSRKGFTPSFAV